MEKEDWLRHVGDGVDVHGRVGEKSEQKRSTHVLDRAFDDPPIELLSNGDLLVTTKRIVA